MRKPTSLRVFSIDLDGFGDINDLYGHGAGDPFLTEVAGAYAQEACVYEFPRAPEL